MGILSSIKDKLFGKTAVEPAKSTTVTQATAAVPTVPVS
jgi:hypothetical protein